MNASPPSAPTPTSSSRGGDAFSPALPARTPLVGPGRDTAGTARLRLATSLLREVQARDAAAAWWLQCAALRFDDRPEALSRCTRTIRSLARADQSRPELRFSRQATPPATLVAAGLPLPARSLDLEGPPPLDPRPLPAWRPGPDRSACEFRDATATPTAEALAPPGSVRVLGGWARPLGDDALYATDLLDLLAPWLTRALPERRMRRIDEIALEAHDACRGDPGRPAPPRRVLVERAEVATTQERLVARVWTRAGQPVLTAYLSARLRRTG